MTSLRWILLSAGVVLLAAIYLWGRRNRLAQSDDSITIGSVKHGAVPELDEPVIGHARASESAVTPIRASYINNDASSDTEIDTDLDIDGLPPMHAQGSAADTDAFAQTAPAMSVAHEVSARAPVLSHPTVATSLSQPKESSQPPSTHVTQSEAAPRTPKKIISRRKIVALRLSSGSERVEGARLKLLLETANLRYGKYDIYHRLHTDDSPLFSVASMVEPGTFDPVAMSGVQFPGVTLFAQLPGAIDGNEMFAQMLACARELEQGMGGILQDERGMPLTELRAQRLREDVADFVHLLGND